MAVDDISYGTDCRVFYWKSPGIFDNNNIYSASEHYSTR